MKTEPSLTFIAGDIAAEYGSEFELDRRELANAIEAALRDRDERAARIADERARELQRMATANLLDNETVARFRSQSAICSELAHRIRGKD